MITVLANIDGVFKLTKTKNNWKAFKELIDCDFLEPAYVSVNGVEYEILADDEGMLKEDVFPTVFMGSESNPQIFGNIIVCHYNRQRDVDEGLTAKDISLLTTKINLCCDGKSRVNQCLVVD